MDTIHSPPAGSPEERFRALFAEVYSDLLRFAQRRVHPSHAEDAVADAMLVIWRRIDEAPRRVSDQRAWAYGITRGCLLNARRGLARQEALAVRMADASPPLGSAQAADHGDLEARLDLARAWDRLDAATQEVLALTAFEGLTSPEAARVLGTTAAAYRLRLMRARRALRSAMNAHTPHPLVTMETTDELA